MDSLVETYREAGVFAHVHVLVLVAGLVWALGCAVLLGLRWKVAPVLAVGPLCVVPLLVGVGSSWAYDATLDAAAQVDPAQRAMLMSVGLAEGLTQGWFGTLVLPVAVLLGLGGLAAGVRAPRAWGVPALVLVIAGLTAVLPFAGLLLHAEVPSVLGRMMLYGLGVVPLALATANGHAKQNGPEGGMIASAAWISVVGACELAHQAASWTRGFAVLGFVDPERRATLLTTMSAEIGAQATLGWVIFALTAVPALVCAFRSTPPLTEEEIMAGDSSPSPWRSLARVLALLVWPCWAFALAASNPTTVLETLLLTMPR